MATSEPRLSNAALVRRFEALFKAMSTDFLLREQFVTDPSQILHEYLFGTKLPAAEAAANNQLLFSVMSSQRLLRWLRAYVLANRRARITHSELKRDFGKAVVEQRAERVVYALIRSSVEQIPIVDISTVLQLIFNSGIFVKTEDPTDPSTDISVTTPSTDINVTTPSTDINVTTPSTDINVTTPSTDINVTTASTDINVTTPSTDISVTTPSTDISGVTSPFGNISFFGAYYFGVTLEALAQYSKQLADSGALDEVASEE